MLAGGTEYIILSSRGHYSKSGEIHCHERSPVMKELLLGGQPQKILNVIYSRLGGRQSSKPWEHIAAHHKLLGTTTPLSMHPPVNTADV